MELATAALLCFYGSSLMLLRQLSYACYGSSLMLVTAALLCILRQLSGFETRHLSKIQNGRHQQKSGQQTLARQNNIQKRPSRNRLASGIVFIWALGSYPFLNCDTEYANVWCKLFWRYHTLNEGRKWKCWKSIICYLAGDSVSQF